MKEMKTNNFELDFNIMFRLNLNFVERRSTEVNFDLKLCTMLFVKKYLFMT